MDFIQALHHTAEAFVSRLDVTPTPRVRIVASASADGISSSAILCLYLRHCGVNFSLSFSSHVTDVLLHEIRESHEDLIVFCDVGVGRLAAISSQLTPHKIVFVFEHHLPRDEHVDSITYLNPCLHGIDGTRNLSTSGILHLLVYELGFRHPHTAVLALVGAVGDAQERGSFVGLNKFILERHATNSIDVVPGVNLFGGYTKPLVDVLEHSLSPFLPGITGQREAVVRFLQKNHIQSSDGKKQRWLKQLSPTELQHLITALAPYARRGRDALFGNAYLVRDFPSHSESNLQEYSALLNACARRGECGTGLGVCLGHHPSYQHALQLFDVHHRSLLQALMWFHSHRSTDNIREKPGYVIIDAEGYIPDHILGTVLSFISRSNLYEEGTILVALAYTLTGDIHLSSRVCGHRSDINLRSLLERVTSVVGGQIGGHNLAAGGVVKADKEDELLSVLDSVLSESLAVQETASEHREPVSHEKPL